jgi:hypothetical protein
MNTIRIALLQMKPRLRDILTDAVVHEQDMELVPYGFALAAGPTPADPVVLVREVPDPLDAEVPGQLLGACPRARVLLIADSGEQAAVYELRPMCRVLPNLSIGQVLDAVRFGIERGTGQEQRA